MTPSSEENLPPELELTLAHTGAPYRDALRIFFDFDRRLGRIVAGTNEPMLGQMRLAWWRDTLSRAVEDRPSGDAVLDAIGRHWRGHEAALIGLVDGWEHLLGEPPLKDDDARKFAAGRSAAMRAVFKGNEALWDGCCANEAARQWALADLAVNVSLEEEREMLIGIGLEKSDRSTMPSPLKGIAVLGALAVRSLENGARPLMEGRAASLVALRAAFFGR
jgi:phytoene synthase